MESCLLICLRSPAMSKLEERLDHIRVSNAYEWVYPYDSHDRDTWGGYMEAKLREAVGLVKLGELDNGYRQCRFCKSTTHDGQEQTHKPDCAAQRFLEG
ncbi:MAG: hypothetical protein J3T61_00760, partial [Candidatus Brocadiales bacterium]|nr:hypothetical protein [Candidatus Bathyanammoxibius sp.]